MIIAHTNYMTLAQNKITVKTMNPGSSQGSLVNTLKAKSGNDLGGHFTQDRYIATGRRRKSPLPNVG
jgi:hypothetical protein